MGRPGDGHAAAAETVPTILFAAAKLRRPSKQRREDPASAIPARIRTSAQDAVAVARVCLACRCRSTARSLEPDEAEADGVMIPEAERRMHVMHHEPAGERRGGLPMEFDLLGRGRERLHHRAHGKSAPTPPGQTGMSFAATISVTRSTWRAVICLVDPRAAQDLRLPGGLAQVVSRPRCIWRFERAPGEAKKGSEKCLGELIQRRYPCRPLTHGRGICFRPIVDDRSTDGRQVRPVDAGKLLRRSRAANTVRSPLAPGGDYHFHGPDHGPDHGPGHGHDHGL